MKHSPLQLIRYVVADLSCTATPTFDPQKPFDPAITEQFSVNATVTQQKVPEGYLGHSWSVEMSISQILKEGHNFPYTFKVLIVGFFSCLDGFPSHADEEQFVHVNGCSMLYGAVRELVRSVTSRGPWGELFIPSISFYDKQVKPKEQAQLPPKQD